MFVLIQIEKKKKQEIILIIILILTFYLKIGIGIIDTLMNINIINIKEMLQFQIMEKEFMEIGNMMAMNTNMNKILNYDSK